MAETATRPADAAARAHAGSRRRARLEDLGRLVRQPKGLIGLVLVGFYAVLAAIGPYVVPLDPYAQNFAATLQPPSASHWFGTDQLGRDVLAGCSTIASAASS